MANQFDLNGDGKIDASEMHACMMSIMAPVSRERLCNDLLNTSVMAALVGGFALGSLSKPGDNALDTFIYFFAYCAVHLCTCSALTSSFIYASVNNMEDGAVKPWAKKYRRVLLLPIIKFVTGCMSYLLSVILGSWRDLNGSPLFRLVAAGIGVSSLAVVWSVFFILRASQGKEPPFAGPCSEPLGKVYIVGAPAHEGTEKKEQS
jgi:hypothetical protein